MSTILNIIFSRDTGRVSDSVRGSTLNNIELVRRKEPAKPKRIDATYASRLFINIHERLCSIL